jgi:hypothetical protein
VSMGIEGDYSNSATAVRGIIGTWRRDRNEVTTVQNSRGSVEYNEFYLVDYRDPSSFVLFYLDISFLGYLT